jgi:formate hydrogenlyase transcriptional activator
VQDYALFLLDADGQIVAWYAGAERIYGYKSVRSSAGTCRSSIPTKDALRQAAGTIEEGRRRRPCRDEGWHVKKDGSRFWANVITMALKDENGDLQGFAGVVRDFSDRHERDEKLRRSRARNSAAARRNRPSPASFPESLTAFRRRTMRFSNWSGYSREDLQAGRLRWPDLTPPEYLLWTSSHTKKGCGSELARPFEKELIRKDGTRVPVLVATAVLKLSPFRWITFVQDLRERDRLENIDEEVVEVSTTLRRL